MNNVGIMLLIGKLAWIHKEDKNSKKEILQLTRADPQYRTAEQQVRANTHPSFRGLNYQPHNYINMTGVVALNVECSHCGALKFPGETDSFCCCKENVQLELLAAPL